MGFAAALVDLDGLLTETEHLGQQALAEVWAERVVASPLSADEQRRYVGRPDDEVVAELAAERGLDVGAASALHRAYRERYLRKLRRARLAPAPGVLEGLERLAARLPLALVTGSTREQADVVLARLGLGGGARWQTIVTADDVAFGKPHPMPYREAARRLGVPIHRCLVVEDSEPGVLAGRGAGAAVLHVGPFHPQVSWIADRQLPHLGAIDDQVLGALWHRRPLAGTPPAGATAVLRRVIEQGGLAATLAAACRHRAGAPDLWSRQQRLAANPPPRDAGPDGALLWHLLVCGHTRGASPAGQPLIDALLEAEWADLEPAGLVPRLRLLALAGGIWLKEPPRQAPGGQWLSRDTYLEGSSLVFLDRVREAALARALPPVRLLEVGIGSGLVLATLLRRFPAAAGTGTDLNGRAVHLARANAELAGVADRFRAFQGDLLAPLEPAERFDLVLFHPPYRIMPPEVPYPDPLSRYGTGTDGLDVVRRFLGGLPGHLAPGGEALVLVDLPCAPNGSTAAADLAAGGLFELAFEAIAEPITAKDMARTGAAKCLEGDRHEHERRLLDAYRAIDADAVVPTLMHVSWAEGEGP